MRRLSIILLFILSCSTIDGQVKAELQDSLESVSKLLELQEIVVKGNLPNTRLKGNAMITRIQGTPLSDAGTLGEMLVKVPGMTGTYEAPEVLGKGIPLIYRNQPSDNKRGEKRKNRCKSGDWDENCEMMRTVDCNLSTV